MKIDIDIPDGVSGLWSIQTQKITKEMALYENIRCATKGSDRRVGPGIIKVLKHKYTVVMSNTNSEIIDFIPFSKKAKGDILINGLGLGMCLKILLKKKSIKSITVIEKSKDVIKLVSQSYKDDRVTIINADAFEWKPPQGKVWNYIWHDIWDFIDTENLLGMAKLHRKYSRKCEYQESWCKKQCLKLRKEDNQRSKSCFLF